MLYNCNVIDTHVVLQLYSTAFIAKNTLKLVLSASHLKMFPTGIIKSEPWDLVTVPSLLIRQRQRGKVLGGNGR